MIADDGTLYVDHSTLAAVTTCDTQGFLRYALGYTASEERAALLAGTALHRAVAAWFRRGHVGQARQVFEVAYREWAEANVPTDDRLSWRNTSLVVDRWLETHPAASLPWTTLPEYIEAGFAYPLTDDIVYTGRIDDLVAYAPPSQPELEWCVVDTKSTSRLSAPWRAQWIMDAQITGYVWAAQQLARAAGVERPVSAGFINAVEFARLPSDPTKICRGGTWGEGHGVPYAECARYHARYEILGPYYRTPEQIEEWRVDAIRWAKEYRRLAAVARDFGATALPTIPMRGKWTKACRFCEFNSENAKFCAAGRPTAMLGTALVREPWDPLAHAGVVLSRTI